MTDRTNKYRLAGLRVEHDKKTDMGWRDRRQTEDRQGLAGQKIDRHWWDRGQTGTGGTETDRDWRDKRLTGTGGTEDRQGLAGQMTDRDWRDRRQGLAE